MHAHGCQSKNARHQDAEPELPAQEQVSCQVKTCITGVSTWFPAVFFNGSSQTLIVTWQDESACPSLTKVLATSLEVLTAFHSPLLKHVKRLPDIQAAATVQSHLACPCPIKHQYTSASANSTCVVRLFLNLAPQIVFSELLKARDILPSRGAVKKADICNAGSDCQPLSCLRVLAHVRLALHSPEVRALPLINA